MLDLFEQISEDAYNDLVWLMDQWELSQEEVIEKIIKLAADDFEGELSELYSKE